jgi:hypothetical protein
MIECGSYEKRCSLSSEEILHMLVFMFCNNHELMYEGWVGLCKKGTQWRTSLHIRQGEERHKAY